MKCQITPGCHRLPGHGGLCIITSDFGPSSKLNPDALIDSNHATNGAEWLLRHRTHVLSHDERGFTCMDCEGRPDDQWLTSPAWNDRTESRDEVLEDVRRRAQGILDVVGKASAVLGKGMTL